jgi:hypothetical protein
MNNILVPYDFKPSSKKKENGNSFSHAEIYSKSEEATDRGNFLLCKQCLQAITHRSHQIIVNGAHEHTFANPHGIVFEIGCFKSAIGCGYVGQPTDEFSWFKGFIWQVAVCGSCITHVGWLFTSSSIDSFIGLILDRIVESG